LDTGFPRAHYERVFAELAGRSLPGLAEAVQKRADAALGSGLFPVAWAADRTIEGVEDPEKPFMLAAQWHADLHRDRGPEHALFEAFIAAAGDAMLTVGRRRRGEPAIR
jgi:gamma-glutamyl-gamma-aminobutyrate hydrolase PuuD